VGGVPNEGFLLIRFVTGGWWFVFNTISGDVQEMFFDAFWPTLAASGQVTFVEADWT
jgi:hypothetical protein